MNKYLFVGGSKNNELLNLITNLRESDQYIKYIFTQGSCYRFHLFLKSIIRECEPLINPSKDHVVTLYKGKLYDITGIVKDDYISMSEEDIKLAESWSFHKKNRLQVGECPICEEPICFKPIQPKKERQ